MNAHPRNPIRWCIPLLFATGILVFSLRASLQAKPVAQETKERPFVVEYYYKAKWGHAEEFIALFKKNHYPLLRKEMELGRIVKVFATVPRYHSTEDGRWDFRTTIIFKNAEIAHDTFDSSPLLKQLFPDQDAYKREEQHRFEILDAHWDVPVKEADLDTK
jgi:hypothetical protein